MDKEIITLTCGKCGKTCNVVKGKIIAIRCSCGEKVYVKKPEEPEKPVGEIAQEAVKEAKIEEKPKPRKLKKKSRTRKDG